MVFSRKPRFEYLNVANCHFTEADIKEYAFDDDQNDFLIAEDKKVQQLGAGGKTSVRQSGSISEVPEPGWVLKEDEDLTESGEEEDSQEEEEFEEKRPEEKNHTFEPTIETEDELLPEDPTDLDVNNTYFAYINMSDSDLLDPPTSIPPSHPLINNLQALSPKRKSLKLNPESLREAAELSSTFRAHIHTNQLHGNEQSIRQYDKQ